MGSDLHGLPETIGRYEIRGLLGRGGMGRVVAGHDPVLNRSVAIKLIEPSAVALEDLAEARYLFHREARAIAALDHPSIVKIFDYSGPEAELMYLACELIDGPTVRDVLDERGALSLRVSAALGYELAGALAHAHAAGIVHRDLKPENVFWTRDGRIVVSDFGIAKAFADAELLGATVQFGATQLYGSPAFLAPEQLEGGEPGPATDLWSFGCVLYECLTGEGAFDGPDVPSILEAVAAGRHQPVGELISLPSTMEHLVERLLRRQASDRPGSASDVAHSLRDLLDSLDVTDPRLLLSGFGEQTAAIDVEEGDDDDDDDTAMFAEPERVGIRIQHRDSPWAPLLQKGPVFVAMIGAAIALASGVYLFRKMSTLDDSGAVFMPPTVTTDPAAVSELTGGDEVFVLLTFPGTSQIHVDGKPVGTWTDNVRLAIAPGRHTIEAKGAHGTVKREVVLVAQTEPTFDLTPPDAASSSVDSPADVEPP